MRRPLTSAYVGRRPSSGADRLGQAGHVAVDDLGLQGERGGGHDDRLAGRDGVGDRGDEVGQGLAGAGAGLHEQVLVGLDRGLDGLGHRHLPGPLDAADALDGGMQERVEIRGHGPKVKPGRRQPVSLTARRAPPGGGALREEAPQTA